MERTKVWLSEDREKNAVRRSNEVLSVAGGGSSTALAAGSRDRGPSVKGRIRVCASVCSCGLSSAGRERKGNF